jgi:thiopeptide-type bacteriocin biosynthesis protein
MVVTQLQLEDLAGVARSWRPSVEEWRAWHIFVQSIDALDRILVKGLLPEARNLGDAVGFFFLRYWENGPHVRARFRGLDDEAFLALGNRLQSCARSFVEAIPVPTETPPNLNLAESWQNNPRIPRFAPGTTVEIMYEPEFRRYGGRHGLLINERLFDASSRLALAIIEKTIDTPALRQSIALTLTATALSQVARGRAKACDFLEGMMEYWRSFLSDPAAVEEQARQTYFAGSSDFQAMLLPFTTTSTASTLQPLAERWQRILSAHFEQLRALATDNLLIHPLTGVPARDQAEIEAALQSIMLSQIHMMNNRLGIVPQQEFHFAVVLKLAFASL